MKAVTGGRKTSAAANGASPPSSRHSKMGPSGVEHDAQEVAPEKAKRPRGRPPKQAWEAPAAVAQPVLMANGATDSQQKPPGKASSASGAAAHMKPKLFLGVQQARVRQSSQLPNEKQQGKKRGPVTKGAGDAGEQPSRRKRRRPARFDSDAGVVGEADNDQKESSSDDGDTDEEPDSTASGQAADASEGREGGSADEASSRGADAGNSTSSSSSSDSESQQHTDMKAVRRRPPAGRRGGTKQGKQQGEQRQRATKSAAARGTRQQRVAQEIAGSNQRRQKGPLARVKTADAGPGSSNTTTTMSTQLLGGAARPIPEVTSYHQAVRRVNHQIQRISTEEHLLQTYTADGWKGASKEKVRLTDDLKRAEQTLARCKESIRQACRYCEEVHPGPPIPASSYDSDGEVDVTDIFCAKCRKQESSDDNDLVLCDGPCNRAYHECCLTPRLVAADIPEDEGWLCPACDAKLDIMIQINDYYNTDYTAETSWQQLFSESPEEQEALQLQRLRSGELLSPRAGKAAAAAAAAGWLAHEFPTTDEEDNSYSESDKDEVEGKHRPQQRKKQHNSRKACKRAAAAVSGSSANSSDGDSSSSSSKGSGGSSSEDEAVSLHSEDGVQLSEPEAAEDDQQLRRSKRRSALDGVAAAAIAAGASPRNVIQNKAGGRAPGRHHAAAAAENGRSSGRAAKRRKSSGAGRAATMSSDQSESADEQQRQKRLRSSGDSSRRRRRRVAVDYKQLHEQLFGFTAFEGDDDVFKEDDDDDYETDSPSDASD